MKRGILLTVIFVLACCLLAGCDLWMRGEYNSIEPHKEGHSVPKHSSREFSTFEELEKLLEYMVEEGKTNELFYMRTASNQQLEGQIDAAILNVKQSHPIGAYAVEEIAYEVGNNAGRKAVSVEISYIHPRSEILRIQDAADNAQAELIIASAMDNCEAGVVLLIKEYEDMDFIQFVQDYVDSNPHLCMEMPQVSATVYPDRGKERVVELVFGYQTSRDSLRNVQQKVQAVFDSARLYVSEEAGEREKYNQLYAFLMERFDYKIETSITPSYSLLHHGVGDSRAFATVYAAFCRQAGLKCDIVSGTKDGRALFWNVIQIGEGNYYVDLLRCNEQGRFSIRTREEMNGYIWDFSEK
jgi:hypothetical protein